MTELKRILELATRPESAPLGAKPSGAASTSTLPVEALRSYAARTSRQSTVAGLIALAALVALPFCAQLRLASGALIVAGALAGALALRLYAAHARATLLVHLLSSVHAPEGRTIASFAADFIP